MMREMKSLHACFITFPHGTYTLLSAYSLVWRLASPELAVVRRHYLVEDYYYCAPLQGGWSYKSRRGDAHLTRVETAGCHSWHYYSPKFRMLIPLDL